VKPPEIPLGERESEELEFKQTEAADSKRSISRSVVAMLNARGGRIWIGIRESQGSAIEVQGVPDHERKRRELRNHLIDSIEPSPRADEVAVGDYEHGGVHVLVIEVRPDATRRPYAALWENGRFFHLRVADRTRFLTREELRSSFAREARDVPEPAKALEKAKEEAAKREPGLWIRLQPTRDLDEPWNRARGEELLPPAATGNRPSGWTFTGSMTEVRNRQQGIEIVRKGGYVSTVLSNDGLIEFHARLAALEHERHGIHPLALAEYTVSILRLASHLYADRSAIRWLAALALFGVKGVELRPYSPSSMGFLETYPGHPHRIAAGDVVVDPPLVLSADDLREPDRCAWRLLARVYNTFGYDETEMPREFDRVTGRFRIG